LRKGIIIKIIFWDIDFVVVGPVFMSQLVMTSNVMTVIMKKAHLVLFFVFINPLKKNIRGKIPT